MSAGDRRKRNARCRGKICACTGECFIDDGTGDFAKKFHQSPPHIQLERLKSRMLGWDDRDYEVSKWRDRAIRYRKAYHELLFKGIQKPKQQSSEER